MKRASAVPNPMIQTRVYHVGYGVILL